MDESAYELFALRVGSNAQRTARENFFFDACCGPPDASMPLDYFFWVAKSSSKVVVIDTCFPRATAVRRQRIMYRDTAEALAELGIDCQTVTDVIITHLHWDHAGCTDLFPNACFHVQKEELNFCTGSAMRHQYIRKTYEEADVHRAIQLLYGQRIAVHDGDVNLFSGLSLHRVGGHTPGSQIVRVNTIRGFVVLASDAVHLWANIRQRSPFPIVQDVVQMLDAFETIEQLADGPDNIIPGHDPQVSKVFPSWQGNEHIFELHMQPLARVES